MICDDDTDEDDDDDYDDSDSDDDMSSICCTISVSILYMYFCNRYMTVTGLLSTPAARIDKLAGSLDARGNVLCYHYLSAVTSI